QRPWLATALHLLAMSGFLAGMLVGIGSVARPYSVGPLDETIETATHFWQNLQFDLAVLSALVGVRWARLRPRALLGRQPYRWAAAGLLLLALSPLLVLSDGLVRPLAKSQYVARSAAGLVIFAIVVFIWVHASKLRAKPAAFAILDAPDAARRLAVFAVVMLV